MEISVTHRISGFVVAALLAAAAPASAPLGTSFTYQGMLLDGADPAEGVYDMSFELRGGADGSVLVQTYPALGTIAVDVEAGLFTVQLEFSATNFTGDRRWLGVVVEGQSLSPYQELTVAPYALFTLDTNTVRGRSYSMTAPATGQVLKWSGAEWTPAADTDTQYAAGTGLSLTGGAFALDLPYVDGRFVNEGQSLSISTAMLQDTSVTDAKIASVGWAKITGAPGSFPPTGPAAGDLAGTYPNPTVVALQGRAVGAAPPVAGQVLKWGGAAWAPAADSDTTYTAGAGLTLAGGQFAFDTTYGDGRYVNENQANSITSAMIVDGAVGTGDLADSAVTSAKIADGTIATADLANLAVTNAKLADNAVTSIKITDLGVGTADLAAGAVTSAKILDGTVAAADLADSSVTSAKIVDGSVGTADLADNAVTLAKMADNSVSTAELANLAVTSGKIADSAITSAKIADGTIATADLADNAVTLAKLADAAVSTAKLANAAVTTAKISSSGAATGKAVMYDGASVTWGNPTAAALVLPYAGSTGSGNYGISVTHTATFSDAPAVLGTHAVTDVYGIGVKGVATWRGVQGEATATGTSSVYTGVWGYVTGPSGISTGTRGEAAGSAGTCYGVEGYAHGTGWNAGVFGTVSSGSTNYAGYFNGNTTTTGTKSFQIDHPLDPAGKYLNHYCAEGPEPTNQYSGVVLLDEDGEAWVELPAYFERINRDFRYQLTAIGGPMPELHVSREIQNNRFHVAGGRAGLKVSWAVTAVRADPYVRTYGAPVEVEKPESHRGRYLHPELYGEPEEQAVHFKADRER